jgi:signal transduction histidine kinase
VDLGALAAETLEELRPLANGCSLRVACEEVVSADADPAWVRQMLINLVENAVHHTPKGGNVLVRVASRDGQAVLEVGDTGAGIAPEHLPHIFDRFYRGDDQRSRADGGAGLGLSIVQWIAQAHGGTVQVASEAGHGACFTVLLPAHATHH